MDVWRNGFFLELSELNEVSHSLSALCSQTASSPNRRLGDSRQVHVTAHRRHAPESRPQPATRKEGSALGSAGHRPGPRSLRASGSGGWLDERAGGRTSPKVHRVCTKCRRKLKSKSSIPHKRAGLLAGGWSAEMGGSNWGWGGARGGDFWARKRSPLQPPPPPCPERTSAARDLHGARAAGRGAARSAARGRDRPAPCPRGRPGQPASDLGLP